MGEFFLDYLNESMYHLMFPSFLIPEHFVALH